MTPADPAGGDQAGSVPPSPRRLSPPPPLYDASDEISLEDPSFDPIEPTAAPVRPTLRGSGPEPSASEPTGTAVRVGRPFRQFWMWAAPGSSMLGIVIGASLFSFGMSVGQAAIATVVGTVLSASLLVAGVLDGRRTGVTGEASIGAIFGRIGARAATGVALTVRIAWAAILLWIFASIVSGLLGAPGAVPVLLVVGIVVAAGIAAAGYRAIVWCQAAVATVGSALVLVVILGTIGRIDVPVAVGIGDGPTVLVLTGTVIVFSIAALTTLPGSSAVGRYQGSDGWPPTTAVWTSLGAIVPLLATVVWGVLVSASDPIEAGALTTAPVDGLVELVPDWARVPVAGAVGLGLLSALALATYTDGFAVQSLGLPIQRMPATLVAAVAIGGLAVAFSVASFDAETVLRDILPTLAVPVVALASMSAARRLVRRRPTSDRRRAVRWYELAVFTIAIVVGYGLMTAAPGWLGWQGYLFASGIRLDEELAASDPGVLVALLIGGLAAIIPSRVRRRPPRGSHRITPQPADTRSVD